MALGPFRAIVGLTVGLWLLAVPLRAAWPTAIMIYGGALDPPVLLGPALTGNSSRFLFLYGASTNRFTQDLTGRRYFDVAIFWGQWKELEANPAAVQELEPVNASQHARLYPPAGALPAVVIATPYMAGSACRADADGQPVQGLGRPRVRPLGAAGFPCGWTLDDAALRELRALNVPGF